MYNFIKFCALVLELHLPQKFFHTHRLYFTEIFDSFLGHSKKCKSMINWKSKIFTKRMLFSMYIVEQKKIIAETVNMVFYISIVCRRCDLIMNVLMKIGQICKLLDNFQISNKNTFFLKVVGLKKMRQDKEFYLLMLKHLF